MPAGTGILTAESFCARSTFTNADCPQPDSQHGFDDTDVLTDRSRLQQFDSGWSPSPKQSQTPAQTLPAMVKTKIKAAKRLSITQAPICTRLTYLSSYCFHALRALNLYQQVRPLTSAESRGALFSEERGYANSYRIDSAPAINLIIQDLCQIRIRMTCKAIARKDSFWISIYFRFCFVPICFCYRICQSHICVLMSRNDRFLPLDCLSPR
jgi:hypothetical protein